MWISNKLPLSYWFPCRDIVYNFSSEAYVFLFNHSRLHLHSWHWNDLKSDALNLYAWGKAQYEDYMRFFFSCSPLLEWYWRHVSLVDHCRGTVEPRALLWPRDLPSAWVRILATVRGEIGHPLGLTVSIWMGFQIGGLHEVIFYQWIPVKKSYCNWKTRLIHRYLLYTLKQLHLFYTQLQS